MRAEVGATWLIGSTRGGNDVKTLSVHQWLEHSDGDGSGRRWNGISFSTEEHGKVHLGFFHRLASASIWRG